MPIFIDPNTRQRILYEQHSGDFQYDLSGDEAISQQTSRLTGEELDRNKQMFGGIQNQLEGEDPGLEGERLPDLNVVGNNKQTTKRETIKRRVNLVSGEPVIANGGKSDNLAI